LPRGGAGARPAIGRSRLDVRCSTFILPAIHSLPTVLLRGESTGRIRRLGGFARHHRVPDAHHDAAQAFVRRAGHPEVKAAAERLHGDIRELFGYKRREFGYTCDDGSALIKTPAFDCEIRVDQCAEIAKNYRLITEVVRLHDGPTAGDPRFHRCFQARCDHLAVNFPQAVDLEAKIDAIEDIPEIAPHLDYAPDASAFELKLPALDLHIHVGETAMTFRLLTLPDLAKLLDHSQKAFDILTQAGFELRLARP